MPLSPDLIYIGKALYLLVIVFLFAVLAHNMYVRFYAKRLHNKAWEHKDKKDFIKDVK